MDPGTVSSAQMAGARAEGGAGAGPMAADQPAFSPTGSLGLSAGSMGQSGQQDPALFDPFAHVPLEEFWSMLGTDYMVDDSAAFYTSQ
jgi:hypothetical protein